MCKFAAPNDQSIIALSFLIDDETSFLFYSLAEIHEFNTYLLKLNTNGIYDFVSAFHFSIIQFIMIIYVSESNLQDGLAVLFWFLLFVLICMF